VNNPENSRDTILPRGKDQACYKSGIISPEYHRERGYPTYREGDTGRVNYFCDIIGASSD